MKSRNITYFKYFSLFFILIAFILITGCSGTPPTVPIINSFTTTYNGNGNTAGTVPLDPSSPYESGTTVTVLGNTGDLIRINDGGTSYYFTGWNLKADGSGAYFTEGSTFIMGATNVILYAQWTAYVLRGIGPAGGYIFYDRGSYLKADFTIVKAAPDPVPITPTYSDWRYLEAAPSDESPNPEEGWGCDGVSISGADGTAVGTGEQNTLDIEAGCTTPGTAADICANLSLGGYTDWFLPSKDELNLMYVNLKLYALGGFADGYYWSSSESSADFALYQRFSSGNQSGTGKYSAFRVRAVRAF